MVYIAISAQAFWSPVGSCCHEAVSTLVAPTRLSGHRAWPSMAGRAVNDGFLVLWVLAVTEYICMASSGPPVLGSIACADHLVVVSIAAC